MTGRVAQYSAFTTALYPSELTRSQIAPSPSPLPPQLGAEGTVGRGMTAGLRLGFKARDLGDEGDAERVSGELGPAVVRVREVAAATAPGRSSPRKLPAAAPDPPAPLQLLPPLIQLLPFLLLLPVPVAAQPPLLQPMTA